MASKKSPGYRRVDVPTPEGGDPKHLFQVTLVVLADATGNPDRVLEHVMSACLQHPKPLSVVDGFGAEVKNLTLMSKSDRSKFAGSGMICTGIKNKPVGKMPEIPVIERVEEKIGRRAPKARVKSP